MPDKWEKIDGYLAASPHGNRIRGSTPELVDCLPAVCMFSSVSATHGFSLGGGDSSFLPQSNDNERMVARGPVIKRWLVRGA